MSQVFCVIPTYNRLAMLKKCVELTLKQDYKDISIIIVEDGCSDGTSEYLDSISSMHINIQALHGDGELWWGGSMRLGMEHVLKHGKSGDYLLMLNDDIEFNQSFVSVLVNESQQCKQAVMGAMQQGFNDRWGGFAVNYLQVTIFPKKGAQTYEVDALPGRGVLFSYDAVLAAGVVNDSRYRQYMGDIEYSVRVKEHGWKLCVCTEAEIGTDPVTSDVEIQQQGLWVKLVSFKSKLSLKDRVFFFSTRGPLWLRPWAFLRVLFMGVMRMMIKENPHG